MRTVSTIILIVLIFAACIKEEVSIIPPIEEEELSFSDSLLIWETLLREDSLQCSIEKSLLHSDEIIITNYWRTFIFDENFVISGLNAETGEKLWEWDEWLPTFSSYGDLREPLLHNGNYLFSHFEHIYSIDVTNGLTKWTSTQPELQPSRAVDPTIWENTYIYIGHDPTLNYFKEGIVFHDIESNTYRVVYEISSHSNLEPNIGSPSVEVNNEGDTIIYFYNQWYDDSFFDGEQGTQVSINFHAYNISINKEIWRQDTVANWNNVNSHVPYILEDRIVLVTQNKVIAFDKFTGELLWEQNFPYSFTAGTDVIGDGKIYVRDNLANTYAVDISTGNIVWQNKETGLGSFFRLHYLDGHLFVITNHIFILNTVSGELKYEIEPHNKPLDTRATFLNRLPAFSEDGKRIYISDTFYDICYQNPIYR